MAIANVTLTNTFDEWRTVTNQIISFVNDVDGGNLTKFYSNSAVLTVTENVARGGKNYITLNTSSNVLDTSTLNVATANAVNIVFAALANTDTILLSVSNNANAVNSVANAAIIQANIARNHANAAFLAANNAITDYSPAFIQANTARVHANLAYAQANVVYDLANVALGNVTITIQSNKAAFDLANISYAHANAAFLAANSAVTDYSPASIQANTARVHANAGFLQANTARDHANASFVKANAALSNTSGSSFAGNLQIPTGNLTIGEGTTQGIRLHVNASIGVANIYPQIRAAGGTQFINLNANTNFGGWNDLMLDRDLSIIYSRGTADDGANIVIGPWTDSSFGYKQDGSGRHGFNTSNPRYVLDANGTANISGSLLVGTINVAPTLTTSLSQANTARDHANAAFAKANTGSSPIVTLDSIDTSRYIIFGNDTSGTLANANVSTTLIYNPSTGTLSSTLFNSTSDINKKRDITTIGNPLEKVNQLNGVHFYWKDSGLPSAGLIAQDLIKVMPELVASDMSVTYSGVIGLLVEAIKELNEKIKKLENK